MHWLGGINCYVRLLFLLIFVARVSLNYLLPVLRYLDFVRENKVLYFDQT